MIIRQAVRKIGFQTMNDCRASSFGNNGLRGGSKRTRIAPCSDERGGKCLLFIECFFFGAVIVCAGFAAKAPHVVERLIAIPARALRFQCSHVNGLPGFDLSGRVDSIADMICFIHDSTTENELPDRRCAGRPWQKYSPIRACVEKLSENWHLPALALLSLNMANCLLMKITSASRPVSP